jgi:transposase
MKTTTTIGLDLAKSIFQVHGVDGDQKVTIARAIKRKDLLAYFGKLPPCLVGMEACGGAHYWARAIAALGHKVKLMPAKYVKAYVKRGKTDASDAAAICEAATRAHVGEVTTKTEAQQCLLMLHKTRDLLIATRTCHANALRAHLCEIGIIAPAGHSGFASLCAKLQDPTDTSIPALARTALLQALAALIEVQRAITNLDASIQVAHKADETSQRIKTANGVGVLAASACAASVDVIKAHRSGRSFAASLGLTPRISGSGGEVSLGSITKQGNGYLRRLLYMGAVSRLAHATRYPAKADPKLLRLLKEKPFKVAAVALANKMARVVWALVVRGGAYVANHQPTLPAARALGCQ